jgi:hypothetical protein
MYYRLLHFVVRLSPGLLKRNDFFIIRHTSQDRAVDGAETLIPRAKVGSDPRLQYQTLMSKAHGRD